MLFAVSLLFFEMDRRSRQAKTTTDRYFYKFISSYVETKYNDAYKEATALLERAKAENPGVKDLVKTATFMREVHPESVIPRYYLNRNLKQQRQQHQADCHNVKEMVLRIPLESYKPPTDTQTVEPVQSVEPTTDTQTVEPVQPVEPTTDTQTVEPVLPPLPDEAYQGLLWEIQQDPDLSSILNDFSMDTTTPDVFDNVLNDDDPIFWQDENSPLELFLLNKTE